jgi:iron complex outermembrane receptor protein
MLNAVNFISATLSLLALLSAGTSPQEDRPDPLHQEVVVTASRTPAVSSDISRCVTIISRREIESAPVHSLSDLLEYALGVDVRQRGPLGVQADVSLRGGTFEQALVLIDGVKVGDPQTGHHHLLLPLTLEDVERVEILKGSGSRLYGPNAFTGVINIITRKGGGRRGRLQAALGNFGFLDAGASLSLDVGPSSHSLTVSRKISDGYRTNTDFDIAAVSYRASLSLASGEADILAGHTDKSFGASGFYSDQFPNQWEHTRTSLLLAGVRWTAGQFTFAPKAYWRKNQDDFVLDRERPEWYRNTHTSHCLGLEFQMSFVSRLGQTAWGGEVGQEKIESSRLGNHSRLRGGFFLEHRFLLFRNFIVTAGGFAYRYSGWGWRAWPGLEAGFLLAEGMRLHGSWSRSFRVPTFTELYYLDPANRGNSSLKPEKAGEFETGLTLQRKNIEWSLTLFRREGYDLIDWVRPGENAPWTAQNIARLDANGLETSIRLRPSALGSSSPFTRIQAGYTFLDTSKAETPLDSKYVLDHLRHQFLIDLEHRVSAGVKQNWKVRCEARQGFPAHLVVDTRLSWAGRTFELYLEVLNLFNARYRDIGNIPLPGRWLMAGARFELFPGEAGGRSGLE